MMKANQLVVLEDDRLRDWHNCLYSRWTSLIAQPIANSGRGKPFARQSENLAR